MSRSALFFQYRERVVSPAFTAVVMGAGRILAVEKAPQDFWFYSVEAGALAGHGVSQEEALEAFRETFTNALHRLAADAQSFNAFRAKALELFECIDHTNEQAWQLAAQSEHTSTIQQPGQPHAPVERAQFIQVFEERRRNTERALELSGASLGAFSAA